MAEAIRFYFDPLCPWCYQTSRWARHLEQAGEVSIDWAVFSLAIANRGDEGRAAAGSGSAPALRIARALRDAHGNAAAGNFYAALGAAVHERGETVDDPAVIAAALREARVEPDFAGRVLNDPSSWDAVLAEHDDVVAKHAAFGVPTIVLDGGDGPVMFGPIIVEVPDEKEATRVT
jgi:2-hydroxychromene-2-carboxylate isomerase